MLIAIAGGLGGAVCFAVAALCASSSSRQIGAASTLAWVMALGLCVLVAPLALAGHPSRLSGDTVALLCIAGLSNVVGLLLEYVAFRHVAVGIVSAIASTEGMFAAVLSSLFGAPLATSTIILLVVITFGVVLAAAHLDPPGDNTTTPQAKDGLRSSSARAMGRLNGTLTRSALFVVPVAVLFGITLYATGRAGTQAPVIWAILPARLFGTILITSPLLLRRKLKISRRTFPLVLSGGVAEVVGLVELHLRGAPPACRRRRSRSAVCGHHSDRCLLPLRRSASSPPGLRHCDSRGRCRDAQCSEKLKARRGSETVRRTDP